MKKLLSFLACLMLGTLPGFANETNDYYAYSYARISYVNGDVFIQRAGDMGYEEGIVNLPIIENDKLGTQDGRAEIHFGKKNYLRIDRFTQIDFASLPKQGNDRISIHLLSGDVYLRVSYLEREKDFEVHTPDASYYILDVGLYRFSVQENQQTELRVLEGAAEAAGEEGSILIEANEAVIAANGRFSSGASASYASYEDDFASWNRTRDALITRYTANNYLPDELNDYEYELSYHGRWVYERPYGYVWAPNVYDVGWRPYWNGRWVWYPVIGWTWVSYEPWGWCVSHYGRWHWRSGLGWYWIPTLHWGPAWVHWYHGYDYYGWCPLSYYNRPVVIVNNHFYGNYYNDYYPLNSRALTVVHKSQLQNRHIAKAALSSSSVSRLGKISLTNRQPTATPVFNKSSLSNPKAAKVLARSDVRKVSRSFSKSSSISSSRTSSTRIRSQGLSSSNSSQIKRIPSGTNPSGSSGSSRIIQRESSNSSTLGSRSSSSTRVSSRTGSLSRTPIKTYPSSSTTSSSKISSSSSRSIQPSSKNYGINSRSASSSSRSSSIRYYPSSRSTVSPSRSESSTSRSSSRSSSYPTRITTNKNTSSPSSSSRSISRNSYSERTSSVPSYPSRSTSSTYSSRSSSSYSSPSSRTSGYSSSSSYTSPSRNYSSRSSSSYSSSSRSSYSSPSRSSSSSSYTTPSRSSSTSRSSSSSRYSAPSRSTSSSSRSRISTSGSHSSSSVSRSSSSRSSSRSSSSSRRRK